MGDLIGIIFSIIAIIIGFLFGRKAESKHLEDIKLREQMLLNLPVRAETELHSNAIAAQLVTGSVVVANDRFKEVVSSFESFFGKKLTSLESLVDRGRREALLRLKSEARAWGADEVVHLRLSSSAVDRLGVEIFASGTAVKYSK